MVDVEWLEDEVAALERELLDSEAQNTSLESLVVRLTADVARQDDLRRRERQRSRQRGGSHNARAHRQVGSQRCEGASREGGVAFGPTPTHAHPSLTAPSKLDDVWEVAAVKNMPRVQPIRLDLLEPPEFAPLSHRDSMPLDTPICRRGGVGADADGQSSLDATPRSSHGTPRGHQDSSGRDSSARAHGPWIRPPGLRATGAHGVACIIV